MIKTTVPLEQIESMYGKNIPSLHRVNLIRIMKDYGWISSIPPIPAIELPKDKTLSEVKFIFPDGHGRYFATRHTNTKEIPLIVYDSKDDRNEVSKMTGDAAIPCYEIVLSW